MPVLIIGRSIRRAGFVFALCLAVPFAAHAQNQAAPAQNQSAPAQSQTAPAPAQDEQLLKPEQLDALVAPIALYPDPLLAMVLMASTYPLEVVEADRWAKKNKNLKDDKLKAAVDKQDWDNSVKSLAATPEVLSMMSEKLDWTQKLGDAVLAQEPDLMDAIQRMRTKADMNKKLASTKEQKVTRKEEKGKQVIVIEPTAPDTIYVPYYDPVVVYGAWPYPAYPPYYFPPPGYIAGGIVRAGIAFGAGYALGRWVSGGYRWGGGIGWGGGSININRPVNINANVNRWQHNPAHRQGVRYNNPDVRQKFGNSDLRNSAKDRMDFRGRGGDQVLKPGPGRADRGGDRPGGARQGGQRPDRGGAQRPGAGGDRPGKGTREAKQPTQRPSGGAANRSRQGQRPSGQRPSGGHSNAIGNVSSGRAARAQSARGHASMSRGGGGRGGGGGGRRSDIALKHDIVLLGRLSNGIGFYRFRYYGENQAYVGVMAQEVQAVAPQSVVRGQDGYLRVYYDRIGVRFQTWERWKTSGARVPAAVPASQ